MKTTTDYTVDWSSMNTTSDEVRTITEIAQRAEALLDAVPIKRIDLMMDLELTHHKNPLRLDELLAATDGDFTHDICGIIGHLDRRTGELADCFLPRFAV